VARASACGTANTPVLVLDCYAVHPMSHYGTGQRLRRLPGRPAPASAETPRSIQLYFTGCGGDTDRPQIQHGPLPIGPCWLSASTHGGSLAEYPRRPLGTR